jgi:hypothetical protein
MTYEKAIEQFEIDRKFTEIILYSYVGWKDKDAV